MMALKESFTSAVEKIQENRSATEWYEKGFHSNDTNLKYS